MNDRRNPYAIGRRAGSVLSALTIALGAALIQIHAFAAAAQNPGGWAPAQPVDLGTGNINTAASEGCPIESPDGHYLFLASNRGGGKGNIDIWAAYRTSIHADWAIPQNLPEPVNSAVDDFCPTPLTGGRLMFVSRRDSASGPLGSAHIYQTRLDPAVGWLPPEILPCEVPDDVNSFADEFSPSLPEAGGHTILFFSSGRAGNQDIYMSELQSSGRWGPAVPIEGLNTPFEDARPNVSHDGLEIVFDSTRDGGAPDIWTARRSSLFKPWSGPVKLGPNVNSQAAETRASLSRDGRRLYFGSTRAGGQGSADTYVSIRFVPRELPR
jgi:hypothetical protein